MVLLTVNSGSTSTKLAAFAVAGDVLSPIARESYPGGADRPGATLADFARRFDSLDVAAVAHRVVHGGTRFTQPTLVDAEVESALAAISALAPLHNPPALEWIAAARQRFAPAVAQIAAFDTAFFARLPRVASEYALPASFGTSQGVRRYGFHGLAHEAMWRRWCELRPDLDAGGRIVTLQLGGGCSMAAIDRGRPVDTSMGFSPLEGLVMATRAGDVDPAVVPYLSQRLGWPADAVVQRLNRESGLLGVSGRTSDLSALVIDPSAQAQFAVELYCYRARKYLGAYLAVLGGCDGIVFGGGAGEHVPEVRERILHGMQWAGIALDSRANGAARDGEARISAADSRVIVQVAPGDEERSLARAALSCLRAAR